MGFLANSEWENFIHLFTILRPAQEFFTYGDVTSPVKGGTIQAYSWRTGPFTCSREGSSSCHTRFDTGPGFFPVSSEGQPHSVASYDTLDLLYHGSSCADVDMIGYIMYTLQYCN
jgi:hypothetical protein